MTYSLYNIAVDIRSLLLNDYSGYKENVNEQDIEVYLGRVALLTDITNDRVEFVALTKRLLASMNDQHLQFFSSDVAQTIGFRVRRHENALYVVCRDSDIADAISNGEFTFPTNNGVQVSCELHGVKLTPPNPPTVITFTPSNNPGTAEYRWGGFQGNVRIRGGY